MFSTRSHTTRQRVRHLRQLPAKRPTYVIASMLLLTLLLSACGGSSAASNSAAPDMRAPSSSGGQSQSGVGQNTSASGTTKISVSGAPSTTASAADQQYLIKALQLSMSVKDTRQVAREILTWVSTTDPRSSTIGQSYDQFGSSADGLYTVSLTISVQAVLYPQVSSYLTDYAPQHHGKLLQLRETVQDVSSEFVDTQSRLTNLRAEQQRLLDLLGRAQALTDVLAVEQRLTDVERQIEEIEGQLNALKGKTTFYTINLTLQPIEAPSTALTPQPWQPLTTLHDALVAALGFAEVLASVAIWLAVFSVFIVPPVLLFFYIRRRRRAALQPAPAAGA